MQASLDTVLTVQSTSFAEVLDTQRHIFSFYKKRKILSFYIPVVVGDKTILPQPGVSLVTQKVNHEDISRIRGSRKRWVPDKCRDSIIEKLKSDLNLSDVQIGKLLNMKKSSVKKIEDCLHAITDSLLLGFREFFAYKNFGTVRKFYRKALNFCIRCGYEELIAHWKVFSNYVWINASGAKVESQPILPKYNTFTSLIKCLNLCDEQGRIRPIETKRQAEKMAYLAQTRHFPCGGSQAEEKALVKFEETVTTPAFIKARDVADLSLAAEFVGIRTYNYLGGKPDLKSLPTEVTHISLASAGDYDVASEDGGRAVAIVEDLREFYQKVPDEDLDHDLPLGFVGKDRKGIPRWRTWMRSHTLWAPSEAVLFDPIKDWYEAFIDDDRRWGADEVCGFQIFALALLKAKDWGVFDSENYVNYYFNPIPGRVSCVPEPGGKVRVVTITKWWLIVLQQPAGHFLRKCLSAHPFASGGLMKADQAWLFMDALSRGKDYEDNHMILCSDLSEATDVIDHELASLLVVNFCKGLGLNVGNDPKPDFIALGVVLACSAKQFSIYGMNLRSRSYKGIMMGEPLAKAVLTILNLAVEEEAFCNYIQKDVSRDHLPTAPWRVYHVAGDDHAAIGPESYLNRITENHKRAGSKISPEKHGLYPRSGACRFCETVMFLKGGSFLPVWQINSSTEHYDKSIAVDAIKLRLLSPFSRSTDLVEESNPAIGKGLALARNLEPLNREYFPLAWRVMVRQRFLYRQSKNLPHRREDLLHIMLPQFLGGINLLLPGELDVIYPSFSKLTRVILQRAALGNLSPKDISTLKKVTCIKNPRGFELKSQTLELIKDLGLVAAAKALKLPVPPKTTVAELSTDLDLGKLGMRAKLKAFKDAGWVMQAEVEDRLERSVLFSQILSPKPLCARFHTVPWRSRFESLRLSMGQLSDEVADLPAPDNLSLLIGERSSFSVVELFNLLKARQLLRIITLPDRKSVSRMLTMEDLLMKGHPSLQLPNLLFGPACKSSDWMRQRPGVSTDINCLGLMSGFAFGLGYECGPPLGVPRVESS